jgi:hypothetical protein
MHIHFMEVLYANGELRQDMVKAPSNDTPLKTSNSPRWYPYFKVINLSCNLQSIYLGAYLKISICWVFM